MRAGDRYGDIALVFSELEEACAAHAYDPCDAFGVPRPRPPTAEAARALHAPPPAAAATGAAGAAGGAGAGGGFHEGLPAVAALAFDLAAPGAAPVESPQNAPAH